MMVAVKFNLRQFDLAVRVQTVTYCKDTYTISTANGQTRKFWERNIRLNRSEHVARPRKRTRYEKARRS